VIGTFEKSVTRIRSCELYPSLEVNRCAAFRGGVGLLFQVALVQVERATRRWVLDRLLGWKSPGIPRHIIAFRTVVNCQIPVFTSSEEKHVVQLVDSEIKTREVLDWKGVHVLHFMGSSCSQKLRIFLNLKAIK
jgi:hypothetical protein